MKSGLENIKMKLEKVKSLKFQKTKMQFISNVSLFKEILKKHFP